MPNINTATNGAATTQATLSSVTPIRRRISDCQYCPRPNATTKSGTAETARILQVRACGTRAGRSAKARQIHAATTPSPYPMAAVMPQTIP